MKSPYKGKTGLRRLINAFGYSISGTFAAFKHEDAFRQEVILSLILISIFKEEYILLNKGKAKFI